MKKITAIAWIITMMMTLVASTTFAASGTNYEVEVGKTLRLDISDLGIECMTSGSSYTWEITQAYVGDDTNYSDYLTFISKNKNYAIVKGLKAGVLVGIQYTGYYYYNGMRKEFYDAFYVRVVNSGTPSTGPATLEVFPTPQTMKVGDTKWVYAKQTRAIGGTYFYSEDTSIATVTHGELASAGSYTTAAQITAKKAGKVNIVAKNVNGLTAVCEVTVTSQPVISVSILSSLTMEIGGTYTLTPSVYPTYAETSYTWTSDNSTVATVSSSGMVTAKSIGKANITVKTDNGKSATCSVTVSTKEVTSVSIKSNLSLDVGDSYTLTPTVSPSDAKTSYTWSSDNSGVAAVSQYGVVTAKSAGIANITVKTTNGKSATCLVTVSAKVKLSKTKAIIEKGKTLTLKATVTPSNLPDKSVTWKSSNTKVATVTSAGKVKGVKTGTVTITCTSNSTGAKATCKVTVGSVKLDKTEATILKGKTTTLTATVYPSSLTDKSVTWKSSNTKIATVTSAGKVKGVKAGTATITCTSNATGLKATCTVTIVKGFVTLNKTETYVQKGKTLTLKATVTPETLDDKSVTWESSDTKIATVTSAGKVKGVKYGTATITCTSVATGAKATCQVTVGNVVISMSEFAIQKGSTVTLSATVYPTTLTDKSVIWESSDTKVATVTSKGKVKGVKAGSATITCTSVATGLKGTCKVTVLSTSEARSMIGDDDELTGIEENVVAVEPFDVYDLSGRKVLHQVTSLDGLPDGIYIVNGKKILKKK